MLKAYLQWVMIALYLSLALVIAPPLISSDDWLLFGVGIFILMYSPVVVVFLSPLTKQWNKK